ncbi:unnamed protein product, partial [Prunus brigantina]
GDKGSSLGSSNLSRSGTVGDGSLRSGSGGKKKEATSQSRIGFNENLASVSWILRASPREINLDAMDRKRTSIHTNMAETKSKQRKSY